MKTSVNLMSDAARFRTAMRINARRWALALVAAAAALAPLAAWRWRDAEQVRQRHEALEASYEPIRKLNAVNVELGVAAAALVRDHRLPLQLARKRPVTSLLGIVAAAAAASEGELFVEHVNVAQAPLGVDGPPATHDCIVIEVAATLTYDVARFVEALKVAPVTQVKVVADEVRSEHGPDHKHYRLECLLSAPAPPPLAHAR